MNEKQKPNESSTEKNRRVDFDDKQNKKENTKIKTKQLKGDEQRTTEVSMQFFSCNTLAHVKDT